MYHHENSRGWHARRMRVQVQPVGGKLEVWPLEFAWVSGILYNVEGFRSKE